MIVRHQLTGVRCAILAASLAVLLASAAPVTALEYEPNVYFFLHPAGQQPDKAKPERRKAANPANKAAKRKALAKEAGKGNKKADKEIEKAPAGPVQIVISIRKQQMTLYSGGHVVAHSQVSTGVPGHPTPQGVFSIIEKQLYHQSNIYSGAPMPFMQRITWSGVAMHQGVVPGHPASHGCIRLPGAFAKRLWSLTKVGARVIIAQDEVALSDIANKRLFSALPQIVGEGPMLTVPVRLLLADNTGVRVTDTPLKGAIDAAEAPTTPRAVNQAAQGGAEASRQTAPLSGTAEAVIEQTSQQAVRARTEEPSTGSVATTQTTPAASAPVTIGSVATPETAPAASSATTTQATPIATPAATTEPTPTASAAETTGTAPTTGPAPTTGTVTASAPEPLPPVFEKSKLAASGKDAMLKPGPISVFISRKLGKLFVRKGFEDVFEAPVTIASSDAPLGTHVFTALDERGDGTMRWNVASLPVDHVLKKSERRHKEPAARQVIPVADPNAALDRITIAPDVLNRITALMTPGASLIISDLGYSHETGRGTDFIVLTR
jgi:lipoprotein-anchoring transpeptidase ErfK/SrfK